MTMPWPPIAANDIPETRIDGKHHIGCTITQSRAITVATLLFPDEVSNGSDCHNEVYREGQPCSICADRNEQWIARVKQVRLAMIEAFSRS